MSYRDADILRDQFKVEAEKALKKLQPYANITVKDLTPADVVMEDQVMDDGTVTGQMATITITVVDHENSDQEYSYIMKVSDLVINE